MTAMFSLFETTGNGLDTYKTWLEAISDNVANVNTVRPYDEPAFQARYVSAQAVNYGSSAQPGIGSGSRVAGVLFGSDQGRIVADPDHPYANEEGYVRLPRVDLGDQLTQMIVAQRAYQANIAVVERARNVYQAALRIGR